MVTYSIGRGDESHIVLNDAKISRHHALLKVYNSGKIEIVDMSQNGTWVNGMKIPSNKPFPVKRNDAVIFANAERLNWNLIPKPYPYLKWGLVSLAVLVFILLIIVIAIYFGQSKKVSIGDMSDPAKSESKADKPNEKAMDSSDLKDKGVRDFFTPTSKQTKVQNQEANGKNDKNKETESKENKTEKENVAKEKPAQPSSGKSATSNRTPPEKERPAQETSAKTTTKIVL